MKAGRVALLLTVICAGSLVVCAQAPVAPAQIPGPGGAKRAGADRPDLCTTDAGDEAA